jgi:putative transposase
VLEKNLYIEVRISREEEEVMALSMDLRQRIVESYENKEGSMRKLAERFKVSANTVCELVARHRQGRLAADYSNCGRPSKLDDEARQTLAQLVKQDNDATEVELSQALAHEAKVQVSRATIGYQLRKMNITRKKRHGGQVNRTRSVSKS